MSNHVAVEIDGNVKRFDRKALSLYQIGIHCLAPSIHTFVLCVHTTLCGGGARCVYLTKPHHALRTLLTQLLSAVWQSECLTDIEK